MKRRPKPRGKEPEKRREPAAHAPARRLHSLGPWWILVACGVGFVARSLYLLAAQRRGLFENVFLDSLTYAKTAASIAAGNGPGAHPYLLSPLYPYLLAPFVAADRTLDLASVQWIQVVFGTVTVGLTAWIARRICDERAGILAGFVAAVFGPLVFFDAQILVASLQTFLLSLSLLLLTQEARRGEGSIQESPTAGFASLSRWLSAGLALGLSAALRPTGLAVAVIVLACLAWDGIAGRRRMGAARRASSRGLALVAGLIVVVVPFTIRNLRESGEAVLLSANGGINFWIGNNAQAPGLFVAPPGYDQESDPVGQKLASYGLGHEATYAEASRWWRGRALSDIADRPLRWVGLMFDKVVYFGHPHEIGQMVQDFAWHADLLWMLRFPLDARVVLLLALLAPLAAGLRHGAEGLQRLRWPIAFVGSYGAAICLFFVTSRHRIPIMPAAISLASVTTVQSWDLLRPGPTRRRGPGLLMLGSVALGLGLSFLMYDAARAPYRLAYSDARSLANQGRILAREGRSLEAIEMFERSLALQEDPAVRFDLAGMLLKLERWDEGERTLDAVVRMQPNTPHAWFNLGFIYETRHKELERARDAYLQALHYDPDLDKAHFRLGVVYLRLGQPSLTLGEVETFFRLAPPDSPMRSDAERLRREAARRLGG